MKLSRVHPFEWLCGLFGIALVISLTLPWSSGDSAISSPGLVDVLLLGAGVAAILVPVVVAASVRTNVPIVYETLFWIFSLLLALIMLIKVAFPPDSGYQSGFWVSLVGAVCLSFSLWRSVDREV